MANTFKRRTQKNIGTTLVLVGNYTVPASTQGILIGLTLCNKSSGAIQANVMFANSTSNTAIFANIPIPYGSSVVPVGGDQKVVMQVGDGIRVCSNASNSLDAHMSFLEIV